MRKGLVYTPVRGFAAPPKKAASKAKKQDDKESAEKEVDKEEKQAKPEHDETADKEDPKASKAKTQQAEQDDDDEYEQKAEFKSHRRAMFLFGKFLKYSIWLASGVFLYHFYLVMNKDKPEEGIGASDFFL